ncbi:glycoside hydrolase family 3 C-terminal domain-containing protein [Lutimonas vermicola]|uniref:Glycoside hydrolase family 3 C-terminal domain-containing protein n=1 Tax=Lutimonas vermicola TaxID=414288 RepID=A0ABU9L319_9FLAO
MNFLSVKPLFHWALTLLLTTSFFLSHAQEGSFKDPKLPAEDRIALLLDQMTLEEKISQMVNSSKGIERLGILPYDWWNEALHGVGRSGNATIFPQAIGMAATFDKNLLYRVSTAISDEARAMFNASQKAGNYRRYTGLSFWTPNVNIFRDPRWGRGQETYGEDPFLTGILGASFVKGLQGDHPTYLKTAACAKHFAVHSGPEKLRHEFNAKVSQKDLYETYLPAFEQLVASNVESVMCAYNRVNDEVCCGSNTLLTELLIDKWNFQGHILTDCGALTDFYSEIGHGVASNSTQAAALALKSGVSLNCGNTFSSLLEALELGLIKESDIDDQLSKLLKTRFKLGLFDPPEMNPYNKIPSEVIDSKKHRDLAYETAVKSMVLLKNNGVLPLKNNLQRYYVVGPNAASIDALLGNYFGVNSQIVTFLEGISSRVALGSQVQYSPGTTLDRPNINPADWSTGEAAEADANIVVMGLTRHIEGEEGESISSPYSGDRLDYNIPQNQMDYLKKIKGDHGKPVIVIITGGCPMNLSEVHDIADAVLFAWYPGEEGGNAAADILFGHVSPSGRLPITFPKSLDQLPAYEDYSMKGRTYRYMTQEPMYPFGYGLSYAKFMYSGLKLSKEKIRKKENTTLYCTVKNSSEVDGDEIVQLYISANNKDIESPLFSLKAVERISLKAGESKTMTFDISPEMLSLINENGEKVQYKGSFQIFASGSLPTERSRNLGAEIGLNIKLDVN